MIIELRSIQLAQLVWRERNFPTSREPWVPALGISEECGEICHSVLKRYQGIRGTEQEHLDAIADGIGDVTIYLLDLCNMLGLNFDEVLEKTWEQVNQRDWITYPINGRTE